MWAYRKSKNRNSEKRKESGIYKQQKTIKKTQNINDSNWDNSSKTENKKIWNNVKKEKTIKNKGEIIILKRERAKIEKAISKSSLNIKKKDKCKKINGLK